LFCGGVVDAGVEDLPGFSGNSIGGWVEFCAGCCVVCCGVACCCAASGSAAALNKQIKLQTVAR